MDIFPNENQAIGAVLCEDMLMEIKAYILTIETVMIDDGAAALESDWSIFPVGQTQPQLPDWKLDFLTSKQPCKCLWTRISFSAFKTVNKYSNTNLILLSLLSHFLFCFCFSSFSCDFSVYPPCFTPVSPLPFFLCLQHNLFSTEDIFNSLLRLASNRSG